MKKQRTVWIRQSSDEYGNEIYIWIDKAFTYL